MHTWLPYMLVCDHNCKIQLRTTKSIDSWFQARVKRRSLCRHNISCSAISATWSTCHHEKAGDQRLVDNMCVSADAMQCEIHECKNDVDLCYVMYLYLYRYLLVWRWVYPCPRQTGGGDTRSAVIGNCLLLLGSWAPLPSPLLAHSSNSWIPSSPV